MGRFKIVRIIARLNIGGPSIHTVLLDHELNNRGHRDLLVCGRIGEHEGDMSYLASEKNISPVFIDDLGRDISPLRDLRAFIRIFSIIKREKPDIVHTHTAKAGTLGRLAAILAGVPVKIHTFHGHVLDGYFSPVKAKVFLAIERFLARFTDKVIVVSENVKTEIVDRMHVTSSDKCVVIPLGFDLDRFLACERLKGSLRGKLGIGPDPLMVGIVGRLVPIKNHGMFLAAASRVVESGLQREIKFVIIGDGECRKAIETEAASLGLTGNVIFTGWVRDLPSVYADLDIVVLTSLNEGTPVSVIEACASARPVVATGVGGVGDIVRDGVNGYLVDSGDDEALAARLKELIDNKDKRVELGLRGREMVRLKYSKDRLVSDIESLYCSCMNNRQKNGGVS